MIPEVVRRVYMITNKLNMIYIGSTGLDLKRRLKMHLSEYTKDRYYSSSKVFAGMDTVSIYELESGVMDKSNAAKIEQAYINAYMKRDDIKVVNDRKAFRRVVKIRRTAVQLDSLADRLCCTLPVPGADACPSSVDDSAALALVMDLQTYCKTIHPSDTLSRLLSPVLPQATRLIAIRLKSFGGTSYDTALISVSSPLY